MIQETHLDQWLLLEFSTPAVLADQDFYAGFGMRVSAVEYKALGVQSEIPVRPGAYYTSFINGTGLKEMDLQTLQHRFMIGVQLTGTAPIGGVASGETVICPGEQTTLVLAGYSGFIQWQSSPNGETDWVSVTEGSGGQDDTYITPLLTSSAYYRAEVYQPGVGSAYSNPVLVEVIPATPVITADGDVLISSAVTGNQWYDLNGPIEGATGQLFVANAPGIYYVVVTEGDCVSAPSNQVELMTVGVASAIPDRFMQVYPNPFKNALYFKCNDPACGGNWRLLNLQGNIIAEGMLTEQGMVNLGHLPNGPYLFVCRYEDKFLVKRIIKMDD